MWYNNIFLLNMDKSKSRKKLAKLQNDRLFINTFCRLTNDALSRYELDGLPDTVSQRVILESLLIYGGVVFFEDNGAVLALPGVPSGKGYNIYGEPTSAWVFSRNGLYNKEIDLYIEGGINAPVLNMGQGYQMPNLKQRGVMVWENNARYPFVENTIYYAQAIADTLRTIDVNRKWLKRPCIPVCEESLVPTVTKLFSDIMDNDDIIPVSTGVMDIDKFNLIPVEANAENVKSASELVEWYENKYRELCGVHANTQVDKKGENLISDEVHANDEYTAKKSDDLIDCIQHYLDLVNSQFGLHITVKRKETEAENKGMEEESDDGVKDTDRDNG